MKKHNGQWVFTRKDTWSLGETLKPIIAAGLRAFLEALKNSNTAGVPGRFLEDRNLPHSTDDEMAYAISQWFETIEKMIFAFDSVEPNYTGGWHKGPEHGTPADGNLIKWEMLPDDQEQWDRYVVEKKDYTLRVQEGAELFGKYFYDLWW